MVELNSLYSPPEFINADIKEVINAQIHKLHRLPEVSKKEGLKNIQRPSFTKHFKLVLMAVKENTKSLQYLNATKLPEHMKMFRSKMFRSKSFDD